MKLITYIKNLSKKEKSNKPKFKKLILKSGFKNALKNLGQLIGLGIIITIAITLSMFSILTISRVQSAHRDLQIQSNEHDFVVDLENHMRIAFNQDQWIGGENIDNFNNQDLFEQYLINAISRKGIENSDGTVLGDSFFNWSRTEGRTFRNLFLNNNPLNVKAVSKTAHIDKKFSQNENENILVDKIVLSNLEKDKYFSANKFEASRQVILQPNFAKLNNISRGDIVRLTPDGYGSQFLVKNDVKELTFGGQVDINDPVLGIENTVFNDQIWFQVIGFGTSADFAYPITNVSSQIPSSKKDLIAFVAPEIFGLRQETVKSEIGEEFKMYSYEVGASKLSVASEKDREIYFSGKFKKATNKNNNYLRVFDNEWLRYGNINSKNIKIFFDQNDTDYRFYYRIAAFNQVIWAFWVFTIIVVTMMLMIAFFTIILIIKKQVDEARTKLGTFKALGYKNWELLQYFLPTPITITLVGFCLGYILVLSLQNVYINVFAQYFSITFKNYNLIFWQALIIFIVVLCMLGIITLLIAQNVIEQSALHLLKGLNTQKGSKFGKGFKWIFRKANPNVKLHIALMLASMGKIFITSATLLVSSSLIASVIIIPTTMEKNSDAVLAGLNYHDIVEYNEPVANNPSTFLKTYNSAKQNSWSYNQENNLTDISEASNEIQKFKTAYPLIWDAQKKYYVYDTKTIIKDILENNLASNFYSYNIPIGVEKNFTSYYDIAKNNYTNWKVLSTEYLKNLDQIKIPDREMQGVPYNALATITNQWTDYKYLINVIEKLAVDQNTNITVGNSLTNLRALGFALQNFYKKYVDGLPLQISEKFVNESKTGLDFSSLLKIDFNDQLSEVSTLDIYNQLNVKSPIKLAAQGNNKLFYDNSQSDWNNWKARLQSFVDKDFKFKKNNIYFENKEVTAIDLNSVKWTTKEFLQFNTNLILWYWINFEGRLGTMLLQASYQNANNVVQQNMKNALLANKDFNITNNVVPFDSQVEELGTLINGTYYTSNQELNLKIYGLNKESQAVSLLDHKNRDLKENLFKDLSLQYQNYIPIIINQTIAHKLNLQVKDLMDVAVLKKLLVDQNNQPIDLDDVKMGIKQEFDFLGQSTSGFYSEAQKNYLAYNELNKGWTSQAQITTASIAGHALGAKTIDTVGEVSEIINAVSSGSVKKVELGIQKKFIVVGVNENYGESKAWIANERANEILGYDRIKKYFFNNFFINEWKNSPALKAAYIPDEMYSITEEQWKGFVDYLNFIMLRWSNAPENNKYNSPADNPYDDFINMFMKLADDYESKSGYKHAAKYFWTIFENTYPIFNYKFVKTQNYNDQLLSASQTQPFGDYSPTGLMGSSVIKTDAGGISEIVYTQGFKESGLKQVRSLEGQKKLLNQVDSILRFIIYVAATIALLISTIIIIIMTILIINENAQFIATMKILGYTNRYVMTQVLGIYLLPFLLTYILGFIGGWFGIQKIVGFINANYSFVVPYTFMIWMPFLVLLILTSVYFITVVISYKQFSKISPVASLQTSA